MIKLVSGDHLVVVEMADLGWCEIATGREYLLPVRVAERFVRFWNRKGVIETTERYWVAL